MTDATQKPVPADERPYHHGNLASELIAAAVAIIEADGVEALSLREVARRAGVSPGAPFRHFRSKAALVAAVAEQAMERLTAAVNEAQAAIDAEADPLGALEAIGLGYLDWALANPTHFEVISSRRLIDFEASASLTASNEVIRSRMVELLQAARRQGRIAADGDIDLLVLSARAFVYGLARMAVDGHFPEWHRQEPPAMAMRRALSLFIARLTPSQ